MVEGARGLHVPRYGWRRAGSQSPAPGGGLINEVRPVYVLNAFLPSACLRRPDAGPNAERNETNETIPGDQRQTKYSEDVPRRLVVQCARESR